MNDYDRGPSPRKPGTTLINSVVENMLRLVRQEVKLARQETIEKAAPALRSLGLMVAGGVMVLVGGGTLLQAVVRLLAIRLPGWLASLLTGILLALGGIALIGLGRGQLKSVNIVPQKTLNSLQENKEWLVHQIKSRLTSRKLVRALRTTWTR